MDARQEAGRQHLAPFFGALDVREIREEHLLEYVQTKLAAKRLSEKGGSQPRSPLKPATIRLHLAILRRVLGLLEREGKIPKNPARGMGEVLRRVGRSLASETEEVEHWTRGEVRALIRLAREHEPRFAPLLALLFATGLRRSEALGLHWSDVDLDSRVLAVRRATTKEGLTTPKSGKARRVPLPPGLAEELFDLLASRRREAQYKGWPDVRSWVFCSEVGGAPDPATPSAPGSACVAGRTR
jgi:integrase